MNEPLAAGRGKTFLSKNYGEVALRGGIGRYGKIEDEPPRDHH